MSNKNGNVVDLSDALEKSGRIRKSKPANPYATDQTQVGVAPTAGNVNISQHGLLDSNGGMPSQVSMETVDMGTDNQPMNLLKAADP